MSPPTRLDRSTWIARFAARLRMLLLNAPANEIATEQWDEAGDLEPEEAAEIYAAELPPGDPGAPPTS